MFYHPRWSDKTLIGFLGFRMRGLEWANNDDEEDEHREADLTRQVESLI